MTDPQTGWRTLEIYRDEVDVYLLDAVLPSPTTALTRAIRHLLVAGGKRIRAGLCLMTAQMLGRDRSCALPAAAAVELVHAMSLVHDDLPCMDDGELRRGQPTVHRVFGEGVAVLAGDALLALAFETVCRVPDPSTVPAVVQALARACGYEGMAGGQAVDIRGDDDPSAAEHATRVAAAVTKTSALFGATMHVGALSAGATSSQCAAMASCGLDIGRAFQGIDDLLDELATTAELGKQAGADRGNRRLSSVAAFGVEGTAERVVGHLERASARATHTLGVDGAAPVLRVIRMMRRQLERLAQRNAPAWSARPSELGMDRCVS